MKVTMHQLKFRKNPNTKTTYIEEGNTTETITWREFNNITKPETLKWFRRLGGSETVTMGYTLRGYLPVKLISTSPNKDLKVVRTFKFN